MTGAGFGGCAMALVDTEAAKSFAARVTAAYFQQTKLEASLYICQPSQGAEVVVGG
jgi:galactokinase